MPRKVFNENIILDPEFYIYQLTANFEPFPFCSLRNLSEQNSYHSIRAVLANL